MVGTVIEDVQRCTCYDPIVPILALADIQMAIKWAMTYQSVPYAWYPVVSGRNIMLFCIKLGWGW